MELANAAARTGQHPVVWKRRSGVIISRPGNDDYTKLNAYRSISLLSCMGMVIETVVTELQAKEAERNGLLSDGQCGSRKRQLAIDAAAIHVGAIKAAAIRAAAINPAAINPAAINAAALMVDRSHAAWREGRGAGVLLKDIKEAFPSVGRGRLVHTIQGKGINGDLIQWTASILSEQTVEMVIEGNVIERSTVEAGLAQGSLVSPILFSNFTSALMKWVAERVSGIEGLSFMDNVGWMAPGSNLSQIIRNMETWARESIDCAERR